MSAFSPSPNNARKQGIRVMRREYPVGVAGVKLSLEEIARRIREGRLDPAVRGWAGDALIKAGRPTSDYGRMTAITNALREATVFVPDPVGAEYNVSAAGTLCLRPGLCVSATDCDDRLIALGSLLMSIGIPVVVVKQTFGEGDQEHVIAKANATDEGMWHRIDPSTDHPVGQSHTATHEFELDPMKPNTIGLKGVPDAEYVGIGAPPTASAALAVIRLPVRFIGATPSGAAVPSTVEVAGAYQQASTDLQNQMVLVIQAGDIHYNAGTYADAITSYQAAGMAGATGDGPEIDLVGAANVTQPYTQQAWNLNTELQEISPTSTSQTDADGARNYVMQMLSLYQTAMTQGQAALDAGGVPPGGSLSLFQAAVWAIGGGALAALLYEAYLARGGKPIPFPPLPAPLKALIAKVSP
jgi:hypothetical protein